MKFNYNNILLFSLSLNIFLLSSEVHTQRNHNLTLHKPTSTSRLLCNCELYEPSNYDNDPEMKRVMQQFVDRTTQRFHEYEERMQSKRMQCKEQCDKEIQKIILNDKLEKELTAKFATLQADIQSDAIPACVCEKSMAEKVEKGCLRCESVFGGGIAPSVGLLGGIGQVPLNAWYIKAIASAKVAAAKAASDAATQAGIEAVRLEIKKLLAAFASDKGLVDFSSIVSKLTYNNGHALFESAEKIIINYNKINGIKKATSFQNSALYYPGEYNIEGFAQAGIRAYNETFPLQKGALETAEVDAVNATYGGCQTAIIGSVVAILIIVLVMVIIYLILRYRRKKKMKKKLQYIKLLEE
ncbi:hypothetical protein PFHG_03518 [Plasmodium falciparum HB3]|uniref:Rifin n=1 Tax=Plasmodium falciparum (isolate HB3) TaxID=137071 RepID=A0A0L7KEP5_PLAFX|nr:hypothetical protein PFHG_03518 [Plasmodium falciparum HB3]